MAQCNRHTRLTLIALSLFGSSFLSAQAPPARFDLTGPKVEVHVTRAGQTLPIASVPNLQPGDQLRVHPDLPATQSVRYLLVVVFLRGTTNPPPDNWFFRIETWNKHVRAEGETVIVPPDAQQAILFLAPETGGDFSTLRSAVRGRPGIFVRASQDLAEAGFEQARIEKYLAEIRMVPPSDPKALAEHSMLLARTLNLKPNDECFKRPVDQQYTCLTQSGNQTLLDDGHGETVVASLTSGSSSDFINAASATSLAGGGTYSAYVGAIVDLVRITSNLHTAQYQYIPAIAFPQGASLNLRLNTPPSFHNPKSVIVIGLPSIQQSVAPPLRPSDPNHVTCLLKPKVVLPVEGAPLVFSTAFAHDLVLHLADGGSKADIPLTADAFQGGLVLSSDHAQKPQLSHEGSLSAPAVGKKPQADSTPGVSPGTVNGTISGFWGFDAFTGPTLQLQQTPGRDWKIAADDPLIAGRENHVLLTSSGSACVQKITLETAPGKQAEATWKPGDKPHLISVDLPLKSADPGSLHLAIHQYGKSSPDMVATTTFSEPATLTGLQFHAGDTFATLSGTSLDQVQHMSLGEQVFTPVAPAAMANDGEAPAQAGATNSLRLSLPVGTASPKLKPSDRLTAAVTLKDGRNLTFPVTVSASRPVVTLISKSISHGSDNIHLASDDDLPVNQQLVFSLKSATGFPRAGKIEIASSDDSLHTLLTISAGTLVLQDPHTLLGTLDPLKTFGTSAFGPLRLRAVAPDGTSGDWVPLAVLVRLPTLTDIHCTADQAAACTLTGSSLYLLDAVGSDPQLADPTSVPAGFVGTTISVPRPANAAKDLTVGHPANTTLYVRLRDDPAAANPVVLPVLPQQ